MTSTSERSASTVETASSGPSGVPRIWTVFLALGLALPLAIVMQIVVLGVLAAVLFPEAVGGEDIEEVITAVVGDPRSTLPVLIAAQLGFLAITLSAALLSPVRVVQRLGLRRPRAPMGSLLLAIPGTLFIALVSSIVVVGMSGGLSDSMKEASNSFLAAQELSGVWFVLAVSVLPGVCEELLCRGLAQRRLLRRWHPAWAIGVSGMAFAALHVDPQHVAVVLPIGLWLGYVAWKADSIWPSVLCHAANNAFWCGSRALSRDTFSEEALSEDPWSMLLDPTTAAMLGITGVAFLLSARGLRSHTPLPEVSSGPGS